MLAEFGHVAFQIKALRRLAGSKLGHHITRKICGGRAKCRFLLEALLAQIDELDCGFASNVIVDRGRDANAARLRDALQPRGDVNAIYKKMSCGSTITSPMLTPTRKAMRLSSRSPIVSS